LPPVITADFFIRRSASGKTGLKPGFRLKAEGRRLKFEGSSLKAQGNFTQALPFTPTFSLQSSAYYLEPITLNLEPSVYYLQPFPEEPT